MQKLIELFGGQQGLADAIGITRGGVAHWVQPKHYSYREVIDPKYNNAVKKAAAGFPIEEEVAECLEDACPTCGRVYDGEHSHG